MAGGYNLSEGDYNRETASDEDLWNAITFVFTPESRNESSYKYGFLDAVMDSLPYIDSSYKIPFTVLFKNFARTYWPLVQKYKLKQKRIDSSKETLLERIFSNVSEEYCIANAISFDQLDDEIIQKLTHKVEQSCKRYVVGALYSDTKGYLYGFSKKERWIQIRPASFEFYKKHRELIKRLNYFEWSRFLVCVNADDAESKDMKERRLIKYRRIFLEEVDKQKSYSEQQNVDMETQLFNDVFPESTISFPAFDSAGVKSIELLFAAEAAEDKARKIDEIWRAGNVSIPLEETYYTEEDLELLRKDPEELIHKLAKC